MSGGAIVAGIPLAVSAEQEFNHADEDPEIIDTNIHLLNWPFRRFKYGDTKLLTEKLRKHKITKAWAGSFESVFSKNISEVNIRLAEECKKNGDGMLLPFGTVNPAWPDWQEDLRRCHEIHHMPGIRVYPAYQTFDTNSDEFASLVKEASERGMIVQVVGSVEDSRVIHPIVLIREVNFGPVIELAKKIPKAKIQLLNWTDQMKSEQLKTLVSETNITLDTSWLESTGGLGRFISGERWYDPETPIAAERILFGSYAPFFPAEANIIRLFESPLTLEQMKAIMNVNATNLMKHA